VTPELLIRRASPNEIDLIIAIDDDACTLYEEAGLPFDIGPDHPFARAEHERWAEAARAGHVFFADQRELGGVGLLVMGFVGNAPYLEQLFVRRGSMRRGIGRSLLNYAIEWGGERAVWLTTYSHFPWNRPFYESAGFTWIPEGECPARIVSILERERRWLPAPSQRIAMCRHPWPRPSRRTSCS
jgi:GNAT superfamily N-acetyltransferase